MIKPLVFLAFVALFSAPANAAEPIDSGWSQLAAARNRTCALSVTGNRQFTRISAMGLGADASGRLILTNGDMKPLDWIISATRDGGFVRYYLPFRWHRSGGEVTIAVESAVCSVSTQITWRRAAVTVR